MSVLDPIVFTVNGHEFSLRPYHIVGSFVQYGSGPLTVKFNGEAATITLTQHLGSSLPLEIYAQGKDFESARLLFEEKIDTIVSSLRKYSK